MYSAGLSGREVIVPDCGEDLGSNLTTDGCVYCDGHCNVQPCCLGHGLRAPLL